jgi:uncharacterized protein YjiS (DUF1127 family)
MSLIIRPAAGHRRAGSLLATWRRELSDRLSHQAKAVRLSIYRGRQRRALGALDDRLLRDVGLTRAEARRECAKPFWRR